MNVMNIIILLIFAFGLYQGYKNGGIKIGVDLIVIYISMLISSITSKIVCDLLYGILPFPNLTGKLKGLKSVNIVIWRVLIYIIITLVLLILISNLLKKLKLKDKITESMVESNITKQIFGVILAFPLTFILLFNILLFLNLPIFNISLSGDSSFSDIIVNNTIGVNHNLKSVYDSENYIKEAVKNEENLDENFETVNDDIISNYLENNVVSKNVIDGIESKLLGIRVLEENKEDTNNDDDSDLKDNDSSDDNIDDNSSDDNYDEDVDIDDNYIEDNYIEDDYIDDSYIEEDFINDGF